MFNLYIVCYHILMLMNFPKTVRCVYDTHAPAIEVVDWLLNVTFNDITVRNVTAHRCAGGLKKLDLRSGSQHHRHFEGFFKVPVKAPKQGQPFYGYFEDQTVPFQSPFTTYMGIRRTYSRLKPPSTHGGTCPKQQQI